MKLVKISDKFFCDCKTHGTESELMYNEKGRPSVLLVNLRYKGKKYPFVVPLRSNISGTAPKEQFFSLPPNKNTKYGNSHGIHYIKIFPIKIDYVESYLINEPYDILIQSIIDAHEKDIVDACQDYLGECEKGNHHFVTPDIDGILAWLYATI